MEWLHYVSYFFGGAFLSNSVPHLISGLMGQPFQSPFAKPSGVGLSSSVVNVVWGSFNLVIAYLLVCHVGSFDIRSMLYAATLGAGFLLMSLMSAYHFGSYNGGNSPVASAAKSR